MSDAGSKSLTGVWIGLFTFPVDWQEPGQFTATLLEFGSAFSGSTHEQGIGRDGAPTTLFAVLDGEREGEMVYFDKTYDGSGGWDHKVGYQGRLNPDWTEIDGRWSIPGNWSGRFLMVRPGREAEANARARLQKVPT